MVHLNILRFEEEIRDLPRERCAVFSDSGERILERDSIMDSDSFPPTNLRECCSFTEGEFERIKDKILSHNHPSGLLFSDDDISSAVEGQLAELRLVTIKGTFSLKRTAGGWPEATTILSKFKEVETNSDYILSLEQDFQAATPIEGFRYDDRDWYIPHLIWKIVADHLGLSYERTTWSLNDYPLTK